MKKITSILFFTLFFVSSLKAQDVQNILLANTKDASKLTSAYMSPAMKGLIYSMNGGWYHTAKVHKKLGFDITIGANASFIPSKDDIFDISKLGLESTIVAPGSSSITPTLTGDNDAPTASLITTVSADGTPLAVPLEFDMPEGVSDDLPLNAMPAPAVQIGIGLPFKFEAMLRMVPKVGSDDVKGGLFGIGVKKEITKLLGPLDKTPLHLSLLAAYTNMSVDYDFDASSGDISTTNGGAEFKLNSYTIQAIASVNLPIINFYGGVGYNGGNTEVNMVGDYVLNYGNGVPAETISDPFSIKNSTGGFNATVGTRLSLGFFKIYGSYTVQEYNTLNAGIAFSFR